MKINPMKAVSFKESAIKKVMDKTGMIAAIKYDGIRCHLVIKPTADINGQNAARLYAMSRTDKVIPALRELFSTPESQIVLGQFLSESLYPNGIILDGEMLVKGVPFEIGSGMLRRKNAINVLDLEFILYGVLPLDKIEADPKADIDVPYCVMFEQCKVIIHQLHELLPTLSCKQEETYEVYDMPTLHKLYEDKRAEGHEGLVVKDPMTPYKRGKKVGYWKVKPDDSIDGKVIDVNWGTEGLANEGKVIGFQVLLEDGTVVNANGITQGQMEEFTSHVMQDPEYYEGWQVEVSFMERTAKGGLRHPSFKQWRGLETSPTIKM